MRAPKMRCAFRGAQNSLNRDLFQYLTLKHDLHTSGTLRAGLAEFRPQKFLDYLSKLLKYVSLLFFTLCEFKNQKVWEKSFQMSYTRHLYNKIFFLQSSLSKHIKLCAQKRKFPKKCLFFVFLCLKCVNQLKMRQTCFSVTRDMVLCLQVKNQTIWWEFCEIKFSRLSYSCRHFFVGTFFKKG